MSDLHLLPGNATSQEKSLSFCIDRKIAAEAIRKIKSPELAPVEILPYLALWNVTWISGDQSSLKI